MNRTLAAALRLSAAAALAALGAACATAPAPRMGAAPDGTPPQLVKTERKDPATGRVLLDWDRPGAFGDVAGDLKNHGDAACMAARADLEALGFHPLAKDENGKPLPGGGYYCFPKANGDKPDAVAPRLVVSGKRDPNGRELLAWDRPNAFGRVPAELQVRGDVACMLGHIAFEAIAYHPAALDEKGQPLPGGGFFCWRKKAGEQPGEAAPRLVRADGTLGWDRPAAFGAVPDVRQADGRRVCGAAAEAIGFHPAALDEAGREIPGGGFFCGPRRAVAESSEGRARG